MPILTIILSAVPALIGSLMIMRAADAGRGPIIQQSIVAVAVIAAAWFRSRRERGGPEPRHRTIVTLFAVTLIALMMPLFDFDDHGPRRWIEVGGFRLYVAAALLPTMTFFLAESIHRERGPTTLVFATGIAAILAVQPDAPQCTAFSAALLTAIGFSGRRRAQKSIFLAAFGACVWTAWQRPDPLEPVPYVEGVFRVAWSSGEVCLAGALWVALLPLTVLVRFAHLKRSPALLSTAFYYVAIGVFVAKELTPMPLLGFGAAPILGYFLFTGFASRLRRRHVL